ncbi:hypothetical protein IAD21_04084 [Abditibacteriota bacterium]|nr:hypothetical protein IAD21_04084 [Abditibacteriota bacterium]
MIYLRPAALNFEVWFSNPVVRQRPLWSPRGRACGRWPLPTTLMVGKLTDKIINQRFNKSLKPEFIYIRHGRNWLRRIPLTIRLIIYGHE